MKWIFRVLVFAIVISPFSLAQATDTVTAHILKDFDKRRFTEVSPIAHIPSDTLIKVWGWLKFETEGTVEPQTYYLEWEYQDEETTVNLGNYNTNENYLVYKRKLDRADDYYWVSKRIWSKAKGQYIFRVYVKEEQELQIIQEISVAIEE